jgi:hypothetical protein
LARLGALAATFLDYADRPVDKLSLNVNDPKICIGCRQDCFGFLFVPQRHTPVRRYKLVGWYIAVIHEAHPSRTPRKVNRRHFLGHSSLHSLLKTI